MTDVWGVGSLGCDLRRGEGEGLDVEVLVEGEEVGLGQQVLVGGHVVVAGGEVVGREEVHLVGLGVQRRALRVPRAEQRDLRLQWKQVVLVVLWEGPQFLLVLQADADFLPPVPRADLLIPA